MAERAAPMDPMPGASRRNAPVAPRSPWPALARRSPSAPLPVEPRGDAPDIAATHSRGHAVDRIQRACVGLAGLPLSRRIRTQRTHLERLLGGSTVLHAIVLVLLAILYARQGPPHAPQDQTPVQVVFGQSGMTGAPAPPETAGGTPPTRSTPPPTPEEPSQTPEINPELLPPPPPVPVPELEPLPPPPLPTQQPPQHTQPMRIPLRAAHPTTTHNARTSPFSNPMDLSFSQSPSPSHSRAGRPSGSHAPVDMSLGPLVKNGHLNTPFATVGIKGVSDDYGNEIDAWIRRHLFYPPDAAQRGEDGASHVHVVIDRDGRVKSVRLVDSSGSYALDDSTTGMFRAALLPPVPPDMQGDHFDIDLTVNYILVH